MDLYARRKFPWIGCQPDSVNLEMCGVKKAIGRNNILKNWFYKKFVKLILRPSMQGFIRAIFECNSICRTGHDSTKLGRAGS